VPFDLKGERNNPKTGDIIEVCSNYS
jgi:hypothetical protein